MEIDRIVINLGHTAPSIFRTTLLDSFALPPSSRLLIIYVVIVFRLLSLFHHHETPLLCVYVCFIVGGNKLIFPHEIYKKHPAAPLHTAH